MTDNSHMTNPENDGHHFCKSCGKVFFELGGIAVWTNQNHDGPFCPDCVEEEQEAENINSGQFGVGA